MAFGASKNEWDHFANALGLAEDLLPVVSNPHAVADSNSQLGRVNAKGQLPKLGKVPSLYTEDRLVQGWPRWTQVRASQKAIREWRKEPDYGVCVQTRFARAIDVDVPDRALAEQYKKLIRETLGVALPIRFREDTGKFLMMYRVAGDEPRPKRWVPVDGGVIEWLNDGQQFIALGTHPDGARYQWQGGLPERIPEVDEAALDRLWAKLTRLYATGEGKVARNPASRLLKLASGVSDARYDWLVDNWDILDIGAGGQMFLRCPFEDDHTSDSGISSTAYFPAGVGGYTDDDGNEQTYERGHWRCLHAHCDGRDDSEFDLACGYAVSSFPMMVAEGGDASPFEVEPDEEDDLLSTKIPDGLHRNSKGFLEPTASNVIAMLDKPRYCGWWFAYDAFLDQLVCADGADEPHRQRWRAFRDADYISVRVHLEKRGIMKLSREILREGVHFVAAQRTMDSATEWLSRLVWDGVPRVRQFLSRYLGVAMTPYSVAISNYAWTAMAARVLDPGCQVDMVPVMIGGQGGRKSSAIAALAPSRKAYVKIDLGARDADLSRKLRGKLVGEFDELRGLDSRNGDDIKAWLTQREEEWVPKFKEFGTSFPRRLMFWGSGNRKSFLADGTGERRWLPFTMPSGNSIDVEAIIKDRDQLWAEGAALWRENGVAWQEAEALAKLEHHKFKAQDTWQQQIEHWAKEKSSILGTAPLDRGFTIADVVEGALALPYGSQNRGVASRVENILSTMGLIESESGGVWRKPAPRRREID